MKKIKKVIFDDDTEFEIKGFKPLNQIISEKSTTPKNIDLKLEYISQFSDIENAILPCLQKSKIKGFAEEEIGMIHLNDYPTADEKTLNDFETSEILKYAKHKGFSLLGSEDVLNDELIVRFINIVNNATHVDMRGLVSLPLLNKLLTNLEQKPIKENIFLLNKL